MLFLHWFVIGLGLSLGLTIPYFTFWHISSIIVEKVKLWQMCRAQEKWAAKGQGKV